jgi:hypothetical protein
MGSSVPVLEGRGSGGSGSGSGSGSRQPTSCVSAGAARTLVGHNARVTDLDFSAEKRACVSDSGSGSGNSNSSNSSGFLILSASADGTARLWLPGRSDAPAVIFSHWIHSVTSIAATATATASASISGVSTGVRNGSRARAGAGAGAVRGSISGSHASSSSSGRNKPFGCPILSAQFFYRDAFVLLAAKNRACVYSYETESHTQQRNDLKRQHSQGRYKW